MGLEAARSLQLFECLPEALSDSLRLGPSLGALRLWGGVHVGKGVPSSLCFLLVSDYEAGAESTILDHEVKR